MDFVREDYAFVSAAYIVTWIVILGYLWHVHRTVDRARKQYKDATTRGAEEKR